jgi:hypothetical protein
MAKFNEILVGRFNRALQKITGIKGGAVVPQLATEVVPSFPLFWGNECRYLESWQMFAMSISNGPSVGNLNLEHFRNPVGSNIMCVVTKITLINDGPAGVELVEGPFPSVAADDLATPIPNVVRFDNRGQQNCSMVLSRGNLAADGWGGNVRVWVNVPLVATNGVYEVINTDSQEFPILPGDAIRIVSGIVNTTTNLTLQWRERFLEESERT